MAEAVLRARSTMDTSNFDKGLSKMKTGAKTFSTESLGGIARAAAGAFSAVMVAEWVRSQLEAADAMVTLAETIGMTTDALQALYSAGRGKNVNVEAIDKGLAKLANAQDQVVNGNKEITAAFGRLGLSAEKVASMNLEELFAAMATGAQNSATAINDITEIMGRGMGVKMMPLLKEIAEEGFGGITAKAKEAGEVIDAIDLQRQADQADQLEHAFKRVTNWAMKFVGYITRGYEDMAAIIGVMAGGNSFGAALDMLNRGEIGSPLARIEAEQKRKDEAAAADLERQQKATQNLKNETEKSFKIFDAAQKKETESYNKELAKRKKDAIDTFQKKVEITSELDYQTSKILNEKPKDFSGAQPIASDQYARIGMFSGGQISNAPRMLAERQLAQQEETNRRIHRVAELQDEANRQLRKMAGE